MFNDLQLSFERVHAATRHERVVDAATRRRRLAALTRLVSKTAPRSRVPLMPISAGGRAKRQN